MVFAIEAVVAGEYMRRKRWKRNTDDGEEAAAPVAVQIKLLLLKQVQQK